MSTAKEVASIYLRQKQNKLNKQHKELDTVTDELSGAFLVNGKLKPVIAYPLKATTYHKFETIKDQLPDYSFHYYENPNYDQSSGWQVMNMEFTLRRFIHDLPGSDTVIVKIVGEYSGELEDYHKWLKSKQKTLDFKLTLKVE